MSVYSAIPAVLTIWMQANIAQALISLQLQPENNKYRMATLVFADTTQCKLFSSW
ncbi:MAG: hypothetical protein ICV63_04580 [Coleofasciculus sp. Co-bin14]|nr:hypothetical protein [Coleofasciculus sp. Co-bin14]